MCMGIYICIYIYLYIYIYIYIYVCMYVCIHIDYRTYIKYICVISINFKPIFHPV